MQKKTHKISIIIPVYNCAKYIDRCLQSIYNQTMKSFEIICINDCSTDSTLLKLQKWAKKKHNLTIINNPVNLGPAQSRNVGILHSTTNWIIFIDADDYILNKYSFQICWGILHNKPEIDLLIPQFVIRSKKSIIKYIELDKYFGKSGLSLCRGILPQFLTGKFIKKTLLNNIENHNNYFAEDVSIIAQCLFKGNVQTINIPFYMHFDQHSQSLSNTVLSGAKELSNLIAYIDVYNVSKETELLQHVATHYIKLCLLLKNNQIEPGFIEKYKTNLDFVINFIKNNKNILPSIKN